MCIFVLAFYTEQLKQKSKYETERKKNTPFAYPQKSKLIYQFLHLQEQKIDQNACISDVFSTKSFSKAFYNAFPLF